MTLFCRKQPLYALFIHLFIHSSSTMIYSTILWIPGKSMIYDEQWQPWQRRRKWQSSSYCYPPIHILVILLAVVVAFVAQATSITPAVTRRRIVAPVFSCYIANHSPWRQHHNHHHHHQQQLQLQLPHHDRGWKLGAVSQQCTFLFDGGELQSFLVHNPLTATATTIPDNSNNRKNQNNQNNLIVGCLTLIVGTITTKTAQDGVDTSSSTSRRIVGVQKRNENNITHRSSTRSSIHDDDEDNIITLDNNVHVYKHTVATIPKHISDNDALSTAAASLVGIHCALPNMVDKVGGSSLPDTDMFYSGSVVVLGGNDLACFFADGLASLGVDVSLVCTSGTTKTRNNHVNIVKPSTMSDDRNVEVGFATAIGQFDCLVDTIANERKGWTVHDSDTGVVDSGLGRGIKESVLTLLQSRHSCNNYISTTTHAQQIIKNDGILFGPGKANVHVKAIESISRKLCWNLIPSTGFGPCTLQTLFDNNVIFPAKGYHIKSLPNVVSRGWNLRDFWEDTSWPRDSSGTGVRYGLPVPEMDEEDDDDLNDIFQQNNNRKINTTYSRTRIGSEGGMDDEEVRIQTRIDEQNPYVTKISGIDGLASTILSSRQTSIIFVSMRSCRTCKRIDSMFTKMARESSNGLLYAKADTSGWEGKLLGRQLGVVAVPAFVLFRDGIRYGSVSTSKLPSDRLDRAIGDLMSGKDFDTTLEEGD